MISVDRAETVALQLFDFIASSPEQLDRLITVAGFDPSALAQALQSRHGLAGVLEYACQDESLLLAFCETAGVQPNMPMQALAVLQKPADTGAL